MEEKKSLTKIIDQLIEVGYLLIIGLTPLYFNTHTYNTFLLNQSSIFQILTEITLLFWLIKIILAEESIKKLFLTKIKFIFRPQEYPRLRSGDELRLTKNKPRPQSMNNETRFNPGCYLNVSKPQIGGGVNNRITASGAIPHRSAVRLFIFPVIIFIAVLGLTTILSQSPDRSFFGSYERKMGYLAWLHFFVFFIILIFNLNSWPKIKRAILAVLLTTGLICLYGFIQLLGLDPIIWLEPPAQTKRVFSTFGQPNFLGAWLLFVIPLIVFSFIIWKKFLSRFFLILLSSGVILIFIFTLSRAAWLGLIGEVFFFLTVFAWFKKRKLLMAGSLTLVFLGFLILILINLYPPSFSAAPNVFERLKSFAYLKQGSSQIRFWWWTDALKLIKKKPIFGYGLENQRLIYHYYYRPEVALYEKINTYPDRAHNEFLDLLLTSGVVGLLSYLFLIGSIFYFGLKKIKQLLSGGVRVYGLLFMALTGLFGYLVSNQFGFPVISTALYFWLFLSTVEIISNRTTANRSI